MRSVLSARLVAGSTLIDVLRSRAEALGDTLLYRYLVTGDIEGPTETWSYADVDRRARAIAARLQEIGAPGERVLLLFPPGLEFIAGFFGCLYAGAVAVPAYPPDPTRLERTLPRLRGIVKDAGAGFVLTTSAVLGMVDGITPLAPEVGALKWVAIDALPEGLSSVWRRPEIGGETLAMLQYTSGSTGDPKGVMVRHSHLLHNSALIQQGFEHDERSSGVGWLPMFHDMGLIGNVIQPLYVGFPCTLMSPLAFLQRPLRWLEAISHFRATTSGGPNFAYDLAARKATPEQVAALDLRSWTVAFNGAEPIRPETLKRFAEVLAPAGFRREAFYPCYGLAEATLLVTGASKAELSCGGDDAAGAWVSSGHSGADLRVEIVDPETRRPTVPREVGEIWVAGPSVAAGYWNRPEQTAETFGACLVDTGEGPFLRTGDLGFFDGEELYVAGRLKDLLIFGGRNHYPQDIERTVEAAHSAVRLGCCAAFGVEVSSEERLAVALEVDTRDEVDTDLLIRAVRQAILEEHGVVAHAVALLRPRSIPKTSSGKIQRRACREGFLRGALEEAARSVMPEAPVEGSAPEAAPPRNATEALLVAIFRDLLSAPGMGIHDDVFALGLHSLLATQAVSRIREALGVEVPLRALFDAPTVAGLAARVDALCVAGAAVAMPPLVPVPRDGELPLSFAQQRFWFLDQLEPDSAFYNIPAAVRLSGPLDVSALERSLQEVVRRHEALRTSFPVANGQPRQQISQESAWSLPVIEVQEGEPSAQEAEVRRRADEEARQPFCLAEGPLLRTTLLRLSPSEHVLLLTMHHVVSDGWSMGVLVREMGALYEALSAGRPSPLLELPIQYADYAVWQRQWLSGDVLEAELAYWKKQLGGAPPALELPTDRPRPAAQTYRGAALSVALSRELSAQLTALSRREGATLFMTLLAAFQVLLSRYTGQDDIVVGTPIASRTHAQTEGLIGFFVNTLVLRTDLSGEPTVRELLGRVREVTLGAYAHQEMPFEKLVEELAPVRDPSRLPLFQVMLRLQNTPMPELSLGAVKLGLLEVERAVAETELMLSLQETEQGLRGGLEYNTDLFDAATIAQMVADWTVLLQQFTEDPGQTISAAAGRLTRRPFELAVVATFTADPIEEILAAWMRELKLPSRIKVAPYGQVFQQLLDPTSALSRNAHGANVILVRFEDWMNGGAPRREGDDREDLRELTGDLILALQGISQRCPAPQVLVVCPPSPGVLARPELALLFQQLESSLASALASSSNILLITSGEIGVFSQVAEIHDPYAEKVGHLPYTPLYFAALGTAVIQRLAAISTKADRSALLVPDHVWKSPDLTERILEKARSGRRKVALRHAEPILPRTPVEEVVAGVWSTVLGLDRVGVEDNFFELGGHSLLATQVLGRLRSVLGVEVPLRALFEAPTVAELASKAEALIGAGGGNTAPPLVAVPREGEIPLSFAQQRLWFLDQLEPDSAFYNIPAAVRLSGPLQVGALEQSLQEVVRRHEALRTRFPSREGQARQEIGGEVGVSLPVVEVQEGEVLGRAEEEAQKPFNLAEGPLLRAALLRLSAHEHVLLVTMHHIVSDGWSMAVLVREVGALYEAFSAGRPSPLPELPIQYADYAVWQRQWLSGDVLETQLAYWKKQLGGAPPALELPTDRPRPAVQTYRGAALSVALSRELSAQLTALSRREGVTLFMTLLAAFHVLLSRYTGQDDIVVGSPIAGRTQAQTEGLIGLFVNTLVLRTDLSGEPTVRELLERVREVTLGAYAHQDVPFEKLVEELAPVRDLSRSPLFQVMLALQSAPTSSFSSRELKLGLLEVEPATAKFDISLSLQETEQGLRGALEYATDLFDRETIARMWGHYQVLLDGLVAEPGRRVSGLPLLTDAERQQAVAWSATKAEYPQDGCLHELFEAQVERTPGAVAVVFERERLTYRELDERANQLAHHLRGLGVKSDVRVGLCVERSLELVVAMLGILKAGGAYVPLDPSYPAERLAFMLEDARAPVLVTQAGLLARLGTVQAEHVVCLDTDQASLTKQPTHPPQSGVGPEHLAYVIYTSGSTGRPKGVENRHGGLVNLVQWFAREYEVGPADRLAQQASMAFDACGLELWPGLCAGAAVHLVPEETRLSPPDLVAWLARERITVAHLPPVLAEPLVAGELPSDLALRALLTGSDKVQKSPRRAPPFRFANHYGPTEASVLATWGPIHASEHGEPPAIGRPLPGVEVYLLDEHLEPVPVGVGAELCIGGLGLGRGYAHRAGLTAERFVPHPYGGGGARLYRTGDLARYRADGTIEFLGRIDHQVKIRGFRIELGEIESVLGQHPAIREAVVLVREDRPGDKRLVAYLVAREAPLPGVSELRSYLRGKLPDYMVPAAFAELSALPITPNGKVDRKALPAPDLARRDHEGAFVAARTPVEEVLSGIWAEVLRVERVSVLDNFFELGGHSLLATQLIGRLRSLFGVQIPLRALFEAPSVATLAEYLEPALSTGALPLADTGSPGVEIDAAGRHEPFPLTEVQQAYWVGRGAAVELGNVAAHGYVEVELSDLDMERFAHALNQLIQRHEMLRAVVLPDGRQQILKDVPVYCIGELDLRGRTAIEVAGELESVRRRMSTQVLPAHQWPLFEIRASCLDGGRTRLHISIDLLIVDGHSLMLLSRQLMEFYRDSGAWATLPSLELSFRDYVLAEQALQGSPSFRRSLDYWLARISSLPPAPELPLARLPSAIEQPRFVRRQARLSSEVWAHVKAKARGVGLTPSGLLLATFAEVLAVWSKSPRFTICLTLFNRPPLHPQINDIIGDFTSLILLEVDAAVGGTFEARARRIQEQLWKDLEHRQVSGVRVLRELSRAQNSHGKALSPVVFTSVLALPGVGEQASAWGEEELVYGGGQTPQVWLDYQVTEEQGELRIVWDAVEELFPPGLLDDMFGAYVALLQRLAQEIWGEQLRCLPPPAQLEVQAQVNETRAPLSGQTLHGLFATQVEQRAAHLAVVSTTKTLTYEELALRAHRLGRRLRELGARPNTLVAVVMDKGWEQVVAALSVLMSGAAYLPIDAELPAERLRHLIEHGEVKLVLTQPWLQDQLQWPESVERLVVSQADGGGKEHQAPLAPVQTPSDLAYVIYTSGSTGLPKGVMIDHQGAVNTVLDINERFGVGPSDRVLALSSLSFDLSVYDVFGTLAAGGTIVVPDASGLRDPAHWAEMLHREQVTVWNSVPALMRMLVDHQAGRPEGTSSSLRLVLLSGDWIPVSLPGELHALLPGVSVISLGGATEASIWSIDHPIQTVDPSWTSIPYGRPLRNQTFHVLDEALEPRPIWVPGQMYIGGVGLALGYWRDEDKTRDRFLEHPRTGERLYRTGDLGRYLPDGNIEFLGREDNQVKIRGYRIELGEIESVLGQHPAIREAVALAREDTPGAKRLVAYVVAESNLVPAADLSAVEKAQFKLAQHGLREDLQGRLAIDLTGSEPSEAFLQACARRRSIRTFLQEPIPFVELCRFLSCLSSVEPQGALLPKYRYPSAGNLYPVQTYVDVKPGRIEGIEGGLYYYHPREHRLLKLSEQGGDRLAYGAGNAAMVDEAAFGILFVGRLEAIEPLYGPLARDFCMLEAGYMGQLLMDQAPSRQLGLCPIGGFDFEPIRAALDVGSTAIYLHGLVGGRADPRQFDVSSLGQESAPRLAFGGAPPKDREEHLRDWLRNKLPDYMVPAAFVELSALPLTPNGKVDRKALPAPDLARLDHERVFVAPRTPVEEALASIWSELLHVERVSVFDSFFELGGHSLLATTLLSRLRTAFGAEVSLRAIFEAHTVAKLAEVVSRSIAWRISSSEDDDPTRSVKEGQL